MHALGQDAVTWMERSEMVFVCAFVVRVFNAAIFFGSCNAVANRDDDRQRHFSSRLACERSN
jgi:hypothetical protein